MKNDKWIERKLEELYYLGFNDGMRWKEAEADKKREQLNSEQCVLFIQLVKRFESGIARRFKEA